jgi:hypothetical protein
MFSDSRQQDIKILKSMAARIPKMQSAINSLMNALKIYFYFPSPENITAHTQTISIS